MAPTARRLVDDFEEHLLADIGSEIPGGFLHDLVVDAAGELNFLAVGSAQRDVGGLTTTTTDPECHRSAFGNEQRRHNHAGLFIRSSLCICRWFERRQVIFALLVVFTLVAKERGSVSDWMAEFSFDHFPWFQLARLEVEGCASGTRHCRCLLCRLTRRTRIPFPRDLASASAVRSSQAARSFP